MTQRVLVAHNFYGSSAPSGENNVVDAEVTMLQRRGLDVDTFFRHSDGVRAAGMIGAIGAATVIPWNFRSYHLLRAQLKARPVDVVHVHNAFPLLSPSVFYAARGMAARVLTLHNYRLYCAAGIPLRDGKDCTLCLERRSVLPALRYGCYRESHLATLPLAGGIALHRALGTWQHEVDAFIALSEFQKQLVVDAGLPADKVHVKSNFVEEPAAIVPWESREPYVVYVGRLGEEKGLRTLVKAWREWGAGAPELRLIGDGPIRPDLVREAEGLPINFLGQLPRERIDTQLANARLFVLPSECLEGAPLSVMEAFSHGTPLLVSDQGALPDLVGEAGVIFTAGHVTALKRELDALWHDEARLMALGQASRRRYETHHSEAGNGDALLEIYRQAQANRSKDLA